VPEAEVLQEVQAERRESYVNGYSRARYARSDAACDHIKAPLTKKRDAQARSAQPQANTAGNLTHRIAISYEIDTRAPNPVHHYALLLDDQFTGGTFTNGHVGIKIDPKECYLYRVETDYKTVFSVPCTTGEIYLAPSVDAGKSLPVCSCDDEKHQQQRS
jgi:hypothetical protein